MRCSDALLVSIAVDEMTAAFVLYGFNVEAIEYAIESAIAVLDWRKPDADDEDREALVDKVINVGLRT